jgi:hypothetical protein
VTVPEVYNVRLEVLNEARYYSLNNLVAILTGNKAGITMSDTKSSKSLCNNNRLRTGLAANNPKLLEHISRYGDEITQLIQRTSSIPNISQSQYDSNKKALAAMYERNAEKMKTISMHNAMNYENVNMSNNNIVVKLEDETPAVGFIKEEFVIDEEK